MEKVRTNYKPHANNGLLQGEKGVLREWGSAVYRRNAGVIFQSWERRVWRVSLTHFGPVGTGNFTEE